jgi:fibronectin type 3 domain-containing protein
VKKKLLGLAIFGALLFLAPSAKAQSTHFIQVGWTYAQGTDLAVGFNVYRSLTATGLDTKLNSTTIPLATLSYQDTTGNGGTLYFYVVTAVDISGIESVNSPQVSATFIASSPNAPAGTTATAH